MTLLLFLHLFLPPHLAPKMRPTQARLLKLFALPLSRQTGSRPPLFYLHAKKVAPASLTKSDGKPLPIPIPTRAAIWAANQWSKLQEGKEGSWKRKAYVRFLFGRERGIES